MQSKLLEFWSPHLERCGFVLRTGGVVEMQNTHENPQQGFRIASEDILRHEADIFATWHTHPFVGGNLSMEDHKCFLNWPEWGHIIVHQTTLRIYYVEQNRVMLHDDSDLPRLSEGAVS